MQGQSSKQLNLEDPSSLIDTQMTAVEDERPMIAQLVKKISSVGTDRYQNDNISVLEVDYTS